jgi:hypothetical protein
MTEVKRYRVYLSECSFGPDVGYLEYEYGDWLRYEECAPILESLRAQLEAAKAALAASEARVSELESLVVDLGDRAHDYSTGPAVPDGYWDLRARAYDAVSNTLSAALEAHTQAAPKDREVTP